MSRARVYIPVVLLVAALFGLAFMVKETASAQDKGKEKAAAPLTKWEYKVIQPATRNWLMDGDKTEQALNKLGLEGWECVGTVSEVFGGGGGPGGDNHTAVNFILKRPIQ